MTPNIWWMMYWSAAFVTFLLLLVAVGISYQKSMVDDFLDLVNNVFTVFIMALVWWMTWPVLAGMGLTAKREQEKKANGVP